MMPIVVIWLRWGALNRTRRRWYAPLPVGVATIVTIIAFMVLWSAAMRIELPGLLPWSLGVFLPPAGLVAIGALIRFAERRLVRA